MVLMTQQKHKPEVAAKILTDTTWMKLRSDFFVHFNVQMDSVCFDFTEQFPKM